MLSYVFSKQSNYVIFFYGISASFWNLAALRPEKEEKDKEQRAVDWAHLTGIDPVQCPPKDKHIPSLYVLSVSVAGKARPVLEDPEVEPKDVGSCQRVCPTETS